MHLNGCEYFPVVQAIVLSGALTFVQRPDSSLLNKPVPSIDIKANTVPDLLGRLASTNEIPIGVEALPETSAPRVPIRFVFRSGSVRDGLDAIVAAHPEYSWEETEGVINILPRRHVESLLDVTVSKFQASQVGKDEAVAALMRTPEVVAWPARSGVQQRSFTGGILTDTSDAGNVSLTVSNANVRTILNRIMKASRSSSWTYIRYGPDNRYLSVSL
jgi:hypothetical protein